MIVKAPLAWISAPGWRGHLLALLAGALTPLALAPFDYWPLMLVSIALFHYGLSRVNGRTALLRGWCYGFALFLTGTGWVYVSIHDYGNAAPPLAALLTLGLTAGLGLLFALLAWLWVHWLRRSGAPLTDALAFASLWLAMEAFRGWFLTGFPWLYAGYSQVGGPLAGLIPLGGVWLASFLVALSAALLASLPSLLRHPALAAFGLALLIGPWVAGQWLRGHAWTQSAGPPLTITAVQGNVPLMMKWDPAEADRQLDLYRNLTLTNSPGADLVIWPETAIPLPRSLAMDYLNDLNDIARQRHFALITGLLVDRPDKLGQPRYYNGISALGEGRGTYLKQKLVPFGEYVPLENLLGGLLRLFDLPMSELYPGPSHQPPLRAKGYSIAPLICYEVVYPELAAAQAARSQILLTISNDTWFGHSIGPLQHLQMARTRALESGRWMIRATNNGVTALIDPQGRVSANLPQFETAVLRASLTPMDGLTPYLRWHFWPLTVSGVLILAWAWTRRRGEEKNSRTESA